MTILTVDIAAIERLPEIDPVHDAQLKCKFTKVGVCNASVATCLAAQTCQNTFN
ncbi:MAG: hypothetical protein ACRDZ4_05210 [Egibacteraceae bacterium]